MCIMIFSENSVLQDTKLVTWEGGISFSFTEVGNVKGILNDFLNWFKFFLTELIFRSLKNKFLGWLDFIFFKKEKGRFSKFLRLLPLLSKVFWDKLFKIWNLIQFQDFLYLKRHFLEKFYVKLTYLEREYNYQSKSLWHVAYWLATCARKPKVPGSSPAASYVQRWALCSNCPANF